MWSSRPLSCDIISSACPLLPPVRSGFPPGRTPQPELRPELAVRNDQLPPHNDMLMDELPGDLTTYYADEEALCGGDEGVSAIPPVARTPAVSAMVHGWLSPACTGMPSKVGSWLAITRVKCISFHGSHPGPTPVDRDPLPDFAVFCHHSQ
jgi:hypothetical protein